MPDRTDDPVNPIKWPVRLGILVLILILGAALWAANNGWFS